MKNKKFQSIIALSMITAMMLAGCGAAGTEESKSNEPQSSSETKSTADTESSETPEEPVKISIWSYMDPELYSLDTNKMTLFVEEKFNVDLEFVLRPADWGTHFNLMIESGDYPDILMCCPSPAQVTAASEAGALLPLNDYIVEGTNYKRICDEHPEFWDYVTSYDGNIYTFFDTTFAVHQDTNDKMWYNVEWLEELGWENPPATPEEFKEYLIQIRDNDVNGNGDPTDEIPLMGYVGGWQRTDPISFLMNPFELYSGYYYITDDQELYFTAITDGWRKGLAYIADLYAEGLIAEETYVQDQATFRGLLNRTGEEALIGVFPSWYGGGEIDTNVMSWWSYAPLAPLKGDYQQTACRTGGYNFSLNAAITTACEHPEVAFELVDWLLSEEALMMQFYGFEGESYEWVEAENHYGTSPALKMLKTGEELNKYKWASIPRFESVEGRYCVLKDDSLRETENTANLVEAANVYKPYHVYDNLPRFLWPDEAITEELSDYEALITSYIDASNTEFIVGVKDINDDAQWQAYLDELNEMGLDKYIDLLSRKYGLK